MNYTFRKATIQDLPALIKLEANWPENERASIKQLRSRIERFAQGYLVCLLPESSGEIIGSVTSCPIHYDPSHPDRISNWNQATHDGMIPEDSRNMKTDTLYVVSSVLAEAYRGGTIYRDMINEFCRVAKTLGFKRILSGAVIPGYDDYCKNHGDITAADYALMKRHGLPLDPFMRVLAKLSFHLPDAAHVKDDYYPDEASRCNAVLVVRELE
ncbi:MAG: hypothetical protein V4727_04970 [Verrucomicrobiota bacterium]